MAEKGIREDLLAKATPMKDLAAYHVRSVVSREIVNKPAGTVTVFAFDAGESLSEHTAPFDALAYILEGRAEVSIEGSVHPLDEGEMIVMPAGKPHSVKACSRIKMLLVMVR